MKPSEDSGQSSASALIAGSASDEDYRLLDELIDLLNAYKRAAAAHKLHVLVSSSAILRAALISAREELVRQRALWTTVKNEAFAVPCIDTELARIDAALSSPNNGDELRPQRK